MRTAKLSEHHEKELQRHNSHHDGESVNEKKQDDQELHQKKSPRERSFQEQASHTEQKRKQGAEHRDYGTRHKHRGKDRKKSDESSCDRNLKTAIIKLSEMSLRRKGENSVLRHKVDVSAGRKSLLKHIENKDHESKQQLRKNYAQIHPRKEKHQQKSEKSKSKTPVRSIPSASDVGFFDDFLFGGEAFKN